MGDVVQERTQIWLQPPLTRHGGSGRPSEITSSTPSTLPSFYILILHETPCAVVRLSTQYLQHVAVNGETSPEHRGEAKCNVHLARLARSEDQCLSQDNCTLKSAPSDVFYLTIRSQSTVTAVEVVRAPASSRQASGAAALKSAPPEYHEHNEQSVMALDGLPSSRIDERKVIVGWDTHTWSR